MNVSSYCGAASVKTPETASVSGTMMTFGVSEHVPQLQETIECGTNAATSTGSRARSLAPSAGSTETETRAADGRGSLVRIYAGQLFDPRALQLLPQQVVTIAQDTGLIVDVQSYAADEVEDADFADTEHDVDLRKVTVLPGFVDAHVHMFLHSYAEASWETQLTKESLVERTVRATVHARRTLMAGYTAVRDLGTEGAEDADIQLRKCISGPNPLIPGPRYFCANRAIITTGSYGPRSSLHLHQNGVERVTGAEFVDGEVECIKAVRRQVGAGADWIKTTGREHAWADVSAKIPDSVIPTFGSNEFRALFSTARQLGVKVAAHAAIWRAELLPENGGVDTLEHGNDMGDELVEAIAKSNIIWVPTLSVFYTQDPIKAPGGLWNKTARTFQKALHKGVSRIVCGGDTGPFAHGNNALEMKLMVRLGADWRLVLRWATLGGWQCLRSMAWEGAQGAARLARVTEMHEDARKVGDNEVPFGVITKEFAADIVATRGDLESHFEDAVDTSNIVFVMKGGKIVKRGGRELV